ncbi:hypothetical protein [Streptomyces sp. NPDC051001]|uniref:hypothetical protein n=1 Tax=Streptomyces sp. NPDC051001 TaxID=3155795 RepID=UPI003430B279
MNREHGRAKAFIDLAGTYAPQFDPLHLFGLLVHRCQQLLEVDAAAVWTAIAPATLAASPTSPPTGSAGPSWSPP